MHTVKRLGQNICKLRVHARRTQYQLSEGARLDRSFLQRIEAGKSSPTAVTLLRIKKVLNCSWDDLFFEVNDNCDAMAANSTPGVSGKSAKSGNINHSVLERILDDLDALIQEAGEADQLDLQELRQARFILQKMITRSSP